MSEFTYPEIGATRRPGELPPPGYHLLRVRTRVGRGAQEFAAAGRAVLGWRMHRAVGVRMDATAATAAPGVRVVVGVGAGPLRLTAPCEVVWTADDRHRAGFAYGTLPGHPECGEESFVVELEPDGTVWLTVTAFSRPAAWYTRAAGPLARAVQRAYAHRLGRVLRGQAGRAEPATA
jgi:uncharacterized protein (UPF0548 family)